MRSGRRGRRCAAVPVRRPRLLETGAWILHRYTSPSLLLLAALSSYSPRLALGGMWCGTVSDGPSTDREISSGAWRAGPTTRHFFLALGGSRNRRFPRSPCRSGSNCRYVTGEFFTNLWLIRQLAVAVFDSDLSSGSGSTARWEWNRANRGPFLVDDLSNLEVCSSALCNCALHSYDFVSASCL